MAPLFRALLVLCVLTLVAAPFALLARFHQTPAALLARPPRACLSALYARLDTGDLVFFRTSAGATTAGLCQLPYSHGAVVLREGPLVYLSECQPCTALMPDPGAPGADLFLPEGACLTPFLPRARYYRGAVFVARRLRPLPAAAAEAMKQAGEGAAAARAPYPGLGALALAAAFGLPARGRHCFQHVAHVLEAGGVRLPAPAGRLGVVEVGRAVSALPGGGEYAPAAELVWDLPE